MATWLSALRSIIRGIALDHPFADGNKRAAYEAAETFVRRNGFRIGAEAEEVVTFMLAVARGDLDLPELTRWIRNKLANL